MSDPLVDFARTGTFGPLRLGMDRIAVLDLLGSPGGSTDSAPVMYAYGDLQVGLTSSDVLWHLAVEPMTEQLDLPTGIYDGPALPTPSAPTFLDHLRELGETVSAVDPHNTGDIWWRVERSGVLINFSPDGTLDAAHCSRLSE